MPKKLTETIRNKQVHVRASQIAAAVRRNSHRCMIADAVAATIPGAAHILVDVQSIRWSDLETSQRFVYLTPHAVQQALLRFDAGQPVRPFSFMLWADAGFAKPMRSRRGDPAVAKARRDRHYPKDLARRQADPPKTREVTTRWREFGLRRFTTVPGVDAKPR